VKKIIDQIKSNKKYQYGLMGVASVIVLMLVLGGDSADDDPYASLYAPTKEATKEATKAATKEAATAIPSDAAGITMGGMMDNEPLGEIPSAEADGGKLSGDKAMPMGSSGGMAIPPASVRGGVLNNELKRKDHGNHNGVKNKKLDEAKHRVAQVAKDFNKPNHSGERDIDTLVADVDSIIRQVLTNFDMDNIKGDALKGTTSQEETLRRLETVLDMTTLIQQKRLSLLEATKNIKLARIDPKRMILREITPLKNRIVKLESSASTATQSLATIRSELSANRKAKGATVLSGTSTKNSFDTSVIKADSNFPKLAMIMHEGSINKAHITYREQVFKLTKPNQTVGTWKVKELHDNYLVIESMITKKKYILTMGGHEPMRDKVRK